MNHQDSSSKNYLSLRGGLVIYPTQLDALEKLLSDLSQRLPARLVLLCESSGQVISFLGNQAGKSRLDLVGLGALVTGDLAASQESARLIGEYEAFQLVLRQGQHSHIFIAEAGHSLVLFVQVASSVPLGWARMLVTEAAHRLSTTLAEPIAEPTAPDCAQGLDQGFSELLGDELNSMWTGEIDGDVH